MRRSKKNTHHLLSAPEEANKRMRTFSKLAFPSWVVLGAALSVVKASELYLGAAPARADDLVRAPSASDCGEVWRTWPVVQRNAVQSGNVMVFDLVSRVGNAFLDLRSVIQVCVKRGPIHCASRLDNDLLYVLAPARHL